ncbi:TetR family transcriptional regulator C-terminal domain-containing protein [Streptosporangium sp. NBC_01495]|uniref:TetR/AcrR family transcriptional regulator n=1 Tax=Streptosporangium sp. NBC_01495 TaxID=2903899 RepID=UPI002E300BD2|nr:TetR family transcriptional regulator C-terminal domain-containing protein [Streptosporangium sp. NBC_01495]
MNVPRLVDHDQRRAELGEAAIRVILREGLAGVSVRGVAAEAGWSTGSLRHYFGNQHELQAYVVRATTDTLRRRVLPRVQRPRTQDSVVERIASIVEEMLPLDAERREEYALWSAIVEWERQHPPEGGSVTWNDQRALYRQCVASMRGHETTREPGQATLPHPDAQVELWAALLHTFVDGLAAQIVNTPGEVSADTAARLLRSLLQAVPRARPDRCARQP